MNKRCWLCLALMLTALAALGAQAAPRMLLGADGEYPYRYVGISADGRGDVSFIQAGLFGEAFPCSGPFGSAWIGGAFTMAMYAYADGDSVEYFVIQASSDLDAGFTITGRFVLSQPSGWVPMGSPLLVASPSGAALAVLPFVDEAGSGFCGVYRLGPSSLVPIIKPVQVNAGPDAMLAALALVPDGSGGGRDSSGYAQAIEAEARRIEEFLQASEGSAVFAGAQSGLAAFTEESRRRLHVWDSDSGGGYRLAFPRTPELSHGVALMNGSPVLIASERSRYYDALPTLLAFSMERPRPPETRAEPEDLSEDAEIVFEETGLLWTASFLATPDGFMLGSRAQAMRWVQDPIEGFRRVLPVRELLGALRAGDGAALERLVGTSYQACFTERADLTAFFLGEALASPNPGVFRALMKALEAGGADLDTIKLSAWSQAVRIGVDGVKRYMAIYPGQIDMPLPHPNGGQTSALGLAVWNKRYALADFLLAAGASPGFSSGEGAGRRSLLASARDGEDRRYLLAKGASPIIELPESERYEYRSEGETLYAKPDPASARLKKAKAGAMGTVFRLGDFERAGDSESRWIFVVFPDGTQGWSLSRSR